MSVWSERAAIYRQADSHTAKSKSNATEKAPNPRSRGETQARPLRHHHHHHLAGGYRGASPEAPRIYTQEEMKQGP